MLNHFINHMFIIITTLSFLLWIVEIDLYINEMILRNCSLSNNSLKVQIEKNNIQLFIIVKDYKM